MRITKYFEHALENLQNDIKDFLFKCNYKMSPNDFTRERKMGFEDVALFILNMGKRSLQLELNSFFKFNLKRKETITKQGYTKAREKIKSQMFLDLSDSAVQGFYEKCDDYKMWNGYRLTAIDGSILEIPNTEILRNEFGAAKNASGEVARAKAVCIFDVLNRLVVKSRICHYEDSESKIATELIDELVSDGIKKELILFDRGYPSSKLIATLMDNKIDFVMRAKKNQSKAVMNAQKEDQTIKIVYKKKSYEVRVLRFMLDSGEEEILLTSLIDKNIVTKDFKEIYFMRWGIEVKFDELKNKFQVENFSGKTKNSVEQDFYATIYLANMYEFARMRSESIIEKKNKDKNLKHEYTQNKNILIGTLKDEFISLALEENERKRNKMLKEIMNQISLSTVPIRPDRQNKRKNTLVNTKYFMHQKRCL